MNKTKELFEETYTISKNSWRYNNLMKVKSKTDEGDHYKIVFFSVTETYSSIKENRLTYILPK